MTNFILNGDVLELNITVTENADGTKTITNKSGCRDDERNRALTGARAIRIAYPEFPISHITSHMAIAIYSSGCTNAAVDTVLEIYARGLQIYQPANCTLSDGTFIQRATIKNGSTTLEWSGDLPSSGTKKVTTSNKLAGITAKSMPKALPASMVQVVEKLARVEEEATDFRSLFKIIGR